MFEVFGAIGLIVLLWLMPRTVGICIIWGLILNPVFVPEGTNVGDTVLPVFIGLSFVASLALDVFSWIAYIQKLIQEIKGK